MYRDNITFTLPNMICIFQNRITITSALVIPQLKEYATVLA